MPWQNTANLCSNFFKQLLQLRSKANTAHGQDGTRITSAWARLSAAAGTASTIWTSWSTGSAAATAASAWSAVVGRPSCSSSQGVSAWRRGSQQRPEARSCKADTSICYKGDWRSMERRTIRLHAGLATLSDRPFCSSAAGQAQRRDIYVMESHLCLDWAVGCCSHSSLSLALQDVSFCSSL